MDFGLETGFNSCAPPQWLTLCLVGGVAQLAERYVRNVEAVGSNPITSTQSPDQGADSGSPL